MFSEPYKIIISETYKKVLIDVANRYNVDSEKLWEVYQKIMKCNFVEDLCDVARVNRRQWKGEDE